MKNVKLNIRKLGRQGFSLIEMLVVIAVIGVIAAIAIPNIGNINDSARSAAAQRNAQSCASVYSAGLAAGCPAATTEDGALTLLSSGTWAPTSGAFNGKIFMVPNLPASTTDEGAALRNHLQFNDYLEYKQAPIVSTIP